MQHQRRKQKHRTNAKAKNTDVESHFRSQSGNEAGSSSVSRRDVSVGHDFAWPGGSGAGLGSTFECTGGFEDVSSSIFEGHGGSAADPSAILEHIGGFEGSSSSLF